MQSRRALLTTGALHTRGYVAPAAAFNHCVEFVRESDRERFLCNMYAPAAARPALFALHAFNAETAKVRTTTSNANLGRMRMMLWRQTVARPKAVSRWICKPSQPFWPDATRMKKSTLS